MTREVSAPAAADSSAIASSLADRIDLILPQTQCRRCGFAGCRPYAEAIAANQADIDQCPPGGMQGIVRLAQLLGVAPKPLNPAYGAPSGKAVAIIDEETCIGCALCLPACPVDAIIGAPKQLHTVIAAYCTGCELCIAPCPVDCIRMVPVPASESDEESERAQRSQRAADTARERHARHLARRARDQREQASSARDTVLSAPTGSGATSDPKPAAVLAAIERAKARSAATLRPAASNPEGHGECTVNGQTPDDTPAPRP